MSRFRQWCVIAAAIVMFAEVAKDSPKWHMLLFGSLLGLAAPSSKGDKR